MAEEILVRESLSEHSIQIGKKLLEEIKKSGYNIKVALWLYQGESSEWRLILCLGDSDNLD
jgi:hypothetical protein